MDEDQTQPARPTPAGESASYLTAVEVAALLQVDSKTVYRWAKQDASFPVLKIGGVVRFPRERLLRWLREREQGQPRIKKQTLSPAKPASLQEAA